MRPASPFHPADTTTPFATADHRAAGRCAVVDAEMRPDDAQHGVHPCLRELRTDRRAELQRRLQEEPSQRPALHVVVGRLAARHREPDGLQDAALVRELGGEHGAVRRRTPLARDPLERHDEAVAGLEVRVEVDLPFEDVGQLQRQIGPLARRVHGLEERRGLLRDLAARDRRRTLLPVRHHFNGQFLGLPVGGAEDAQEAILVDLVLEAADEAVGRALEQIGMIGLETARVEDRPREGHESRHQIGAEPQRGEQRSERGVPRHPAGNRLDLGPQILVGPNGCGRRRRRCPITRPTGEHTQSQAHERERLDDRHPDGNATADPLEPAMWRAGWRVGWRPALGAAADAGGCRHARRGAHRRPRRPARA